MSTNKNSAATLDELITSWQHADAPQRTAALAALAGEPVKPTPGRALNLTAAAHQAGVSRSTIWRAIQAGVLKAAPLFHGGRPRVIESELHRWLAGGAS